MFGAEIGSNRNTLFSQLKTRHNRLGAEKTRDRFVG